MNVLPFALIAFQSHAWQTAERIGHIGIRQAVDDVGRKHLHDIVSGAFTVKRLFFAALAFGANRDLLTYPADLEHGVHLRYSSGSHR